MQTHRRILLVGSLLMFAVLIFSGIYIQNNRILVQNSKELIKLQLINRYSDELGGDLGNYQTTVKSYVTHPSKSKLDSIYQFKSAYESDIQSAIALNTSKEMGKSFDSLKFTFEIEGKYILTSLLSLPKVVSEKQTVKFYEDNNLHLSHLWLLIEQNRIRQKEAVMAATVKTQQLGVRSMYMSLGGLCFIFVVCLSSIATLYSSAKKREIAEEKEKLSLKLLNEQEMLMSAVINNSASIIFIKNLHGCYSLVNKSFLEVYDLTEDRVIGKTDYELWDEERSKGYKLIDEIVLSTGTPHENMEKHICNAEERDFLTIKFPLRSSSGQIFGLAGISTDFTQRARYEEGLKLAQQESEKARKFQERFLANMSHEIRTPMNGIMGMTNILSSSGLNVEQKEFVSIIQQSVDNLMVIINDILDFSKIKSGKLTLENVAFNINDSVNQSVRALKPRAEEKNITLDYFIHPNVPAFVLGDQVRLNQILTNLIGNALKFTQKGGVKLSVEATSDQDNGLQVWFSVNDSGIGIPEEKQELIFDSFTQSSSDTTRKYGGTGLGLSIVKQLVELHSGTISIESKENVGSTFKVGLPYKETYITAENIQKVIDETVYTELAGKRILIVDDNDINLMVAKQTLKKVGISAQTVTGGKEALEMLLNQDFDAVLLDVHMPDMNGYETCRNIRVALKMNIPVIAMTAAAMVEDEEKCLQAGMNGYIAKPFVPKDLYALLMTYV